MSELEQTELQTRLIDVARILMMLVFLVIGWQKMTHFGGAVQYMAGMGMPAPGLAAFVVVIMEFFVPIAIIAGIFTRPLTLLLALFTLVTAVAGHHFWTLSGAAQSAEAAVFLKNVSIAGGLLVLSCAGAPRYSITRLFYRPRSTADKL